MPNLLAVLLCGLPFFSLANEAPNEMRLSQRPDVQIFIDEMSTRHGMDRSMLSAVLDQIQLKPRILAILDRPSTSRPWYEFRPNFVENQRIRQGVAFWYKHAKTLETISNHYEIPPEYLIAIVGVETMYGSNTGSFRVADALATIAFDYPRRAEYFRGQLEQFLLLAREEGNDPLSFRGSYAGAMGVPQFMPSSFREYAVDWDGDHHRDIWTNPADILASIANYFHAHGWKIGEPLVARAKVEGSGFQPLVDDKFNLHYTVEQLASFGVKPAEAVPASRQAVLVPLDVAPDRTEYWLGFNNFYVLTRYNKSTLYAMAVHELARKIRAAYEDPLLLPPAPKQAAKPAKASKSARKHRRS
ncbi:lytic murein transglycosylase B [Parachitinimonas caeni]|uniref:Lytic murein transglycosylase B n=1 Tax=Parachitinimonas caeni TaxID=3031301 RepID=A0ABT7E5L6_9NEIS|nr:lytic murein transglycosylase B [Parachitinimonas caeni]MDK2126207.1 lytic murein transglycosylase B [Parachitinimonas caeni]